MDTEKSDISLTGLRGVLASLAIDNPIHNGSVIILDELIEEHGPFRIVDGKAALEVINNEARRRNEERNSRKNNKRNIKQ